MTVTFYCKKEGDETHYFGSHFFFLILGGGGGGIGAETRILSPGVLLLICYMLFIYARVLICLKRALRIANAAQQMSNAARGSTGSATLFVEILNK